MLKDLVVNLALDQDAPDPAANYALSIAETFEAHIAGVAFALEPVLPASVMGGVSSDLISSAIVENEEIARAAIGRFEEAAKKRGVSVESRAITAQLASATDQFGQIARRFDLCVVAQTHPEKNGATELFVEAALFSSGRPVLVVPYIQKSPLSLNQVVCCWDGSRTAARAIADSMSFLRKAKKIDLLVVTTERVQSDELIAADMAHHLARHGLDVNLAQVTAGDIDVPNAILSYAADASADFLIMGGYGHSRWREFVLGGATRGILSTMTVPTLMSH